MTSLQDENLSSGDFCIILRIMSSMVGSMSGAIELGSGGAS